MSERKAEREVRVRIRILHLVFVCGAVAAVMSVRAMIPFAANHQAAANAAAAQMLPRLNALGLTLTGLDFEPGSRNATTEVIIRGEGVTPVGDEVALAKRAKANIQLEVLSRCGESNVSCVEIHSERVEIGEVTGPRL